MILLTRDTTENTNALENISLHIILNRLKTILLEKTFFIVFIF